MNNVRRDIPVPLYYQLKMSIKSRIANGVWLPGDALPSEAELMRLSQVSRTTVRQAIGELVVEGVITRIQGKGTYVAMPKMQHHLSELTSFTEDILAQGMQPGGIEIIKKYELPPPKVKSFFDLGDGEEIFKLERVRTANNKPVGLHTVYIPRQLAEILDLISVDFNAGVSLYGYLENEKGIILGDGEETLEAGVANERQCALLDVHVGFPVLNLERLTVTAEKEPIEFCEIVYRSDMYKYRVRISRHLAQ